MKHFNIFNKILLLSVFMIAACASAMAQLSGTYTIGGSSPDYATLTDAVADLNTNGVSGPVTFNMRNGTYNEKVVISTITGGSATNRVTIKSETNNAANVTISGTGTAYADNGIIILNSANYVTIKYLTLENLSSNYGSCASFQGSSSNDSVLNCAMVMSSNTSSYSAGVYAGYYGSYPTCSNLVIKNNTITNGGCPVNFNGGTNSAIINNVLVENNTCTNYGYYGPYFYGTGGSKIRNNTFTTNSSSLYYATYFYYNYNAFEFTGNTVNVDRYQYCYFMYLQGTANPSTWAKIENNTFNLTTTTTSSYLYMQYCDYAQIKNNTYDINVPSGSHYVPYMYQCNNVVFEGNDFTATSTTGSLYGYYYYGDNLTVRNNNISLSSSGSGTVYGIYQSNSSNNGGEYTGNKINASSVSGTVYGMYQVIPGQTVKNNIINTATAGSNYTLYSSNPTNSTIVNNIFHSRATGSTNYAGYFGTSSGPTVISNNVFSKTSSTGRSLYLSSSTNKTCDFNNIYTAAGTSYIQRGSPSYTATTLQGWRATTGHDLNSITYDPGYTSATNLAPNPANAASWSLNGRGVQIADNNTDINGNARPTTLVAGVPDIGAYEFTPTSTPPVAVATPAAPAAGTTQIFTFGQDTVATLAWPAATTVPSSISVRQYTGTAPPTIATLSTNKMFFYTDITVPAGTYNHTSNIYYKDPWMGTVAGEPALRLAKKDGSNPWAGYTLPNSTVNTSRNIITTTGVNTFGFHTGIDAGDNASAAEVTNPASPFCSGTFMVTAKVKNTGNNILNNVTVNWSVDGTTQTPVSYTTPINTLGSGLGNEALVPLGNVTFASVPKVIKVWTTNPNSVVDAFNADDTVTTTLRSSLSGVYTIGGASPNYTTIAAAVADLNEYGVCGPVTFNLRNGTYTEQTVLTPVLGMNSVNRVTFKSQSNNAANVTIKYSASSANNYTIKFDSGSYFTFRDLTIKSTNTTYGRVFELAGLASYDSVVNCKIMMSATSSSSSAGVYAYMPFKGIDNVFMGNIIDKGYYGIYLYASSAASALNRQYFINNTFQDQYYYGAYAYYAYDLKLIGNTITNINATASTYFYAGYMYYCHNGFEFRNNTVDLEGPGYLYLLYGYYFYGDATDPALQPRMTGNTFTALGTSTSSYPNYLMFAQATYDSTANNTISMTRSYYNYCYLGYYHSNGYLYNNNIDLTVDGGSGYNYLYLAYYGSNAWAGNNNVTMTNNTSGYNYLYAQYYGTGNVVEDNTFSLTHTGSGGNYCNAGYYGSNGTFRRNNVTMNSGTGVGYNYGTYASSDNIYTDNNIDITTGSGTIYGIYLYQSSYPSYQGGTIARNKVKCTSTSGTIYGLYAYYSNFMNVYNNSVEVSTSSTAYGLNSYYNINSKFYNNLFHSTATGSSNYPGYIYNNASQYGGLSQSVTLHNNIFSKTNSTGYCLWMQDPSYVNSDYNNLYTAAGSNIGQTSSPSTTATTLQQWRNNSGGDLNSIVFDPGFVSATDLQPDPANVSSWSLNGRGVHAGFNNTDINGNPRVTTEAAGVPDIGPYEFTPTVQPPLAIPNIAPAAGTSTVYTFGQDTVAVIAWDAAATIPASVNVRQWTGTLPPSLTGNHAYFYTDIATPTGTYAHITKLYYKDPWGGTLVGESGFRLMKKLGTASWAAFAAPASTTNPTRNINTTTGLTDFGYHTVSDVANNASAFELEEPNGYFCAPATLPIKIIVKNTGNNILNSVKIGWTANGAGQTTVNYTTPIYTANSPQGDEAVVSMGNYTFTSSAPVSFVFYTFSPNGVNDPAKVDDTLKVTIKPGLMGTYTIGGVTPDYTTIPEAIDDLNKFGICGPVVFNIRDGNYTDAGTINSPLQGGSAINRVTFQSESGNAANVTITGATAAVFQIDDISNISFRNLGLTTASTSTRLISMAGAAGKDSVLGCILTGPSVTGSSNTNALIYADQQSGDGNVFLKNTFTGGTMAIYMYYGSNTIFDTNTVSNNGSYMVYMLYNNGLKIRGNTITGGGSSTSYGLYTAYAGMSGNNAPEIIGNTLTYGGYYSPIYAYQFTGNAAHHAKIGYNTVTTGVGSYFYNYMGAYGTYIDIYNNDISLNGTNYVYNYLLSINYGNIYNNKFKIIAGYGYALYLSSVYDCRVQNNLVDLESNGSSTAYTVYLSGSSDTLYNNTFVYNSTNSSGFAGYFSVSDGRIRNNIFYSANAGGAISGSISGTGVSDYNNIYSVQGNHFGTNLSSLQTWRNTTGQDKNSLSYDPGFVSSSDMHPDPTNPASWSLNGRGEHIAGNNMDLDGNPRVTTLAAGVPDIGAYEFTPLTVPPSADATPATPVAGQTQTFTFGQDTVATIKWAPNSVVPNTIDVKQYTGTKAPAFPTGAGFPYYYVDISAANITYNYSGSIYYKDPWRGTTGTEGNLRLLHQVTAPGWMAYNSPMSSSDANRNIIRRDTLSATGLFTMIDDGTLFSAIASAQGNPVFCPGGSVLLYANTGVGYSYQWYFNNAIIPGANGGTYTATQAGDYRVAITNASSVTAQSNTINVVVVAAPSAVVNASGPMTYCTGGTLTLMANTGTGLSYQWKFNNVDIPGATSANYPVTQAGNYTVTVKNIGCSTTSSVQTINAGPLNVNLGTDTAFCQSLTTPLVLDAGYPGAKYVWNTADTTQTIEVSHSGIYYVKVDAGPNCIDWDTINVSVAPLPTVNGISYVKSGNTFMFSPSGEQNTKRYLWIYGGIAQDTNKNSTFTYTGTISMKVMLIVFNDCGSDTAEMELPLNVGAVSKGDINLNLYPNPASKDLIIEIDGGLSFTEVLILDGLGQVVYRGDGENHKQLTLDVSRYANGHYMIRATTSAGFTITKPFNIVR